ncbi:hypothetical protein CSUI_011138 [Cystoisospora suis]|uniref:Uncharacterized protein n=1 Tax=Cystoisospora suis TaxID=483139 RepID=A0A2C6J6Y9_9APIC|nr:hypothetical protein CSUI_011138 [Cystoisospora suis]
MKLRELEKSKAESMQSKIEEMKRELVAASAGVGGSESSPLGGGEMSKGCEEARRRKHVTEWRDKVSKKRNEKLQLEKQRRSTCLPTAALMNLFGRQMDALTKTLEEERRRQEEAMDLRITKKKMDKITKFGDLLTKAEKKKQRNLLARAQRLKDKATRKALWEQAKRKGATQRELPPLVEKIVEEEMTVESLQQYKSDNTIHFHGRFMNHLERLEAFLKGDALREFLCELHSMGAATADYGGVEGLVRGRGFGGNKSSSEDVEDSDSGEDSEEDNAKGKMPEEEEEDSEHGSDTSSSESGSDTSSSESGSDTSSSESGSDTSSSESGSDSSSEGSKSSSSESSKSSSGGGSKSGSGSKSSGSEESENDGGGHESSGEGNESNQDRESSEESENNHDSKTNNSDDDGKGSASESESSGSRSDSGSADGSSGGDAKAKDPTQKDKSASSSSDEGLKSQGSNSSDTSSSSSSGSEDS